MVTRIRVESGRSGFEVDEKLTGVLRAYIMKPKEMVDNQDDIDPDSELPVNKTVFKYIKEHAKGLYKGITSQLEKDGQINLECGRLLIYYNNEDKFFSIIFGLRHNTRKTPISEFRYSLALAAFEENIPLFFVSNYDVHIPIGDWDVAHSQEAPVFDYPKERANQLLGLTTTEKNKRKKVNKEYIDNVEGAT